MLLKYKLAVVLIVFAGIQDLHGQTAGNPDWWKHAVFYQIYPRSFKDSNDDGVGDIQGIISKLDHLKDAGVTAAWLSPIYKSPQVDLGYDISDFKAIDAQFGRMEDFEELIEKAHEMKIKIIMDFVPNHSSDQHEWFGKSAASETGFEDYYVWRDGRADGKPPNNWRSIFKGSAWTYHETRHQFFLHQFGPKQPDLNFLSTKVKDEMKGVLQFWLGKGVDGFRIDAVPFLVEDKRFEDEPRSNHFNAPSDTNGYNKPVYTQNQQETLDLVYAWRKVLDDYTTEKGGDPRVMMTEVYTDMYNLMYYYGDADQGGAHFTFNFFLITDLNSKSNARDIAAVVENWMNKMPTRYAANWVLGNHDNHRVATRFGPENADAYNMLIALLPGIMVTYNGEEIGQEDGEVAFDQCKDTTVCLGPKEDFPILSRDFERTPFQWDATTNAGFNTGKDKKPWLPVGSKYKTTNLAAQLDPSVKSHYQIYKQLVSLRKEAEFVTGSLQIRPVTDDVLVFSRAIDGGKSYVTVLNIGAKDVAISINRDTFSATQYLEVVVASGTSSRRKGDLISTAKLQLKAHEGLVAVTTTKIPNTTTPSTAPTPTAPTPTSSTTAAPSGVSSLMSYVTVLIISVCIVTVAKL